MYSHVNQSDTLNEGSILTMCTRIYIHTCPSCLVLCSDITLECFHVLGIRNIMCVCWLQMQARSQEDGRQQFHIFTWNASIPIVVYSPSLATNR